MINIDKPIGYLAEWSFDDGATWNKHSQLFKSRLDASAFAGFKANESDDPVYHLGFEWRVVAVVVDGKGNRYRLEESQDGDGSDVLCPHCKAVNGDLWELELGDEQTHITECGSCEKPIVIGCSIAVTYSAAALVPFDGVKNG